MKKFFVLTVVLIAAFFLVSCGNSSKNDDKTDTGESVTDEDTVDTDQTDTEPSGDTETPDDADTSNPDNDADSEPNNDSDTTTEQSDGEKRCAEADGIWNETDSTCTKQCDEKPENAVWNGDTTYILIHPNGSLTSFETEYSEEEGTCHFKCEENYFWDYSECVNPCNSNPCDSIVGFTDITCKSYTSTEYVCGATDSSTHLTWSAEIIHNANWQQAKDYCEEELSEGGHTDWRLPTISELRTLIRNCENTEMPDGSCDVRDDHDPVCLSLSCMTSCDACEEASTSEYDKYSKLRGDPYSLWSSSTVSDDENSAWTISLFDARVTYGEKINTIWGRCVRNAE